MDRQATIEQVIALLQKAAPAAAGAGTAAAPAKSEQAFFSWLKGYSRVTPEVSQELRRLRCENGVLLRLIAELVVDKAVQ